MQRERLQKSIALKTSHDSDSNRGHLFDFPLFVAVVGSVKNNWGSTSEKRNIKCVCFTGVAEQFALAEAAMNVWAMNDGLEQPSTSLQGTSCNRITRVFLKLLV